MTEDGDAVQATGELQTGPQTDDLDNGSVRVVLDVSDPVASLGVKTNKVSVEADGKVSEELADHLWHELHIDIDDYDIEVFD